MSQTDDVVKANYKVGDFDEGKITGEPESEVLDFNRPDYKFEPRDCQFKQRGYYLVCHSCEMEHGIFIGRDRVMVGVDEQNRPIVKTRRELGIA